MDGTDPIENYQTIRNELAEYDAALTKRPEIIVVSKSELPEAAEVRERLEAQTGQTVMTISAVTGQNLNTLVQKIVETLHSEEED